jgi:hypothetical protein
VNECELCKERGWVACYCDPAFVKTEQAWWGVVVVRTDHYEMLKARQEEMRETLTRCQVECTRLLEKNRELEKHLLTYHDCVLYSK